MFAAKLRETIKEERPELHFSKNVYFPSCYRCQGDLNIDYWQQSGFETGNTIICPMLQIAAWMGCNPIYLLGVDLNHNSAGNHFSHNYYSGSFKGYTDSQLNTFENRLHAGISRSIKACLTRGHSVINLSPVNLFPEAESKNFNHMLERGPTLTI